MLVDILKLLKSPDIEMMMNAATITLNVSVLLTYMSYKLINRIHYVFYEIDVVCRGPRESENDQRTRGPKFISEYR